MKTKEKPLVSTPAQHIPKCIRCIPHNLFWAYLLKFLQNLSNGGIL